MVPCPSAGSRLDLAWGPFSLCYTVSGLLVVGLSNRLCDFRDFLSKQPNHQYCSNRALVFIYTLFLQEHRLELLTLNETPPGARGLCDGLRVHCCCQPLCRVGCLWRSGVLSCLPVQHITSQLLELHEYECVCHFLLNVDEEANHFLHEGNRVFRKHKACCPLGQISAPGAIF